MIIAPFPDFGAAAVAHAGDRLPQNPPVPVPCLRTSPSFLVPIRFPSFEMMLCRSHW